MFSFQACSPWLLGIIGLVLYLFGSPMQPTIAGPLNLAAESTSSQLSAVPQTLQQDLISETAEAYPNKARLSWASWMSVVCTIAAIAFHSNTTDTNTFQAATHLPGLSCSLHA
jgi:hypothetical protein